MSDILASWTKVKFPLFEKLNWNWSRIQVCIEYTTLTVYSVYLQLNEEVYFALI